jgi:hypothetical protein
MSAVAQPATASRQKEIVVEARTMAVFLLVSNQVYQTPGRAKITVS